MPRIILHLGMSKTGSSSIQSSFREYDDGALRYLRLGAPNHSKAISTLFKARPENQKVYQALGYSKDKVQHLKGLFQQRLDAELALEREAFVLSAEGINDFSDAEVRALRSAFLERSLEPQLLAYVREPVGLISSMFQQNVKFGLGAFSIFPPGYRKRFGTYITVFGRDAMTFLEFAPARFAGGSVVADFAAHIGADMGRVTEVRDNERLSPAAVAFLYFWNKEASRDVASRSVLHARRTLIKVLAAHFGGGFRLGRRAIATAIDRRDIAWMEEQGGFALMPPASGDAADGEGVESEADLDALRHAHRAELAALLDARNVSFAADAGTSTMLDRLVESLAREAEAAADPRFDLVEAVAEAIWKVERRRKPPNAHWRGERDERLAYARRFIRQLERNGLSLALEPAGK